MNTTDSYTLKIVDQILAPLRRIEAVAGHVHESMGRLEKMASGGLGMLKLGGAIGVAVGALGVLHSALSGVFSLMEKAAEGAWEFGRAVLDAAAFRERYRGMLQHQLGDKTGANAYKRVMDIAELTPGTAAESMDNAARLTNIGLRGNLLDAALGGSMDVQAMFGGEKAAMFTRGITDMFSKSKFEVQDFKQAVSGIIPAEVAQAAILRLKGIDVAADKVSATFEQLHKAGKITGREGVIGTLQALEQNLDRGQGLGAFAIKRGVGSLEGLMSNLFEAPQNFLRRMDLENLPGLGKLKEFIGRVLKFFNAATPQGQQLKRVFEQLANALFGGLGKITDQDLARFFESALRMAERLVVVVNDVWAVFQQLISGDTSALKEGLANLLIDVGRLVGQGVVEVMKAGGKNLLKAAGSTVGDAAGFVGKAVANPLAAAGRGVGHFFGWQADILGWKRGADWMRKAGDAVGKLNIVDAVGWAREQDQKNAGKGAPRTLQGPTWSDLTTSASSAVGRQGMEQAGADLAEGAEVGLRRQARSHSPSETMAEAGADLVDGLLLGVKRKIAQLQDGSGSAGDLEEQLAHVLRRVAWRVGAES